LAKISQLVSDKRPDRPAEGTCGPDWAFHVSTLLLLGTVIALAGLEQTASSRKRAQTATNAQALHLAPCART
jgi:hypothetical protein